MNKRLTALRGAVCCKNSEEDIQKQVELLYDELMLHNSYAEEDIVSIIFSVTSDLDELNPAAALRKNGRASDLALFCTAEPSVKNAMPGVIRVLIHCYLDSGLVPVHCYLNGAESLRPDRSQVL